MSDSKLNAILRRQKQGRTMDYVMIAVIAFGLIAAAATILPDAPLR